MENTSFHNMLLSWIPFIYFGYHLLFVFNMSINFLLKLCFLRNLCRRRPNGPSPQAIIVVLGLLFGAIHADLPGFRLPSMTCHECKTGFWINSTVDPPVIYCQNVIHDPVHSYNCTPRLSPKHEVWPEPRQYQDISVGQISIQLDDNYGFHMVKPSTQVLKYVVFYHADETATVYIVSGERGGLVDKRLFIGRQPSHRLYEAPMPPPSRRNHSGFGPEEHPMKRIRSDRLDSGVSMTNMSLTSEFDSLVFEGFGATVDNPYADHLNFVQVLFTAPPTRSHSWPSYSVFCGIQLVSEAVEACWDQPPSEILHVESRNHKTHFQLWIVVAMAATLIFVWIFDYFSHTNARHNMSRRFDRQHFVILPATIRIYARLLASPVYHIVNMIFFPVLFILWIILKLLTKGYSYKYVYPMLLFSRVYANDILDTVKVMKDGIPVWEVDSTHAAQRGNYLIYRHGDSILNITVESSVISFTAPARFSGTTQETHMKLTGNTDSAFKCGGLRPVLDMSLDWCDISTSTNGWPINTNWSPIQDYLHNAGVLASFYGNLKTKYECHTDCGILPPHHRRCDHLLSYTTWCGQYDPILVVTPSQPPVPSVTMKLYDGDKDQRVTLNRANQEVVVKVTGGEVVVTYLPQNVPIYQYAMIVNPVDHSGFMPLGKALKDIVPFSCKKYSRSGLYECTGSIGDYGCAPPQHLATVAESFDPDEVDFDFDSTSTSMTRADLYSEKCSTKLSDAQTVEMITTSVTVTHNLYSGSIQTKFRASQPPVNVKPNATIEINSCSGHYPSAGHAKVNFTLSNQAAVSLSTDLANSTVQNIHSYGPGTHEMFFTAAEANQVVHLSTRSETKTTLCHFTFNSSEDARIQFNEFEAHSTTTTPGLTLPSLRDIERSVLNPLHLHSIFNIMKWVAVVLIGGALSFVLFWLLVRIWRICSPSAVRYSPV